MPEWNRTTNLQLRRLLLYPIELRARFFVQLQKYKFCQLSEREIIYCDLLYIKKGNQLTSITNIPLIEIN